MKKYDTVVRAQPLKEDYLCKVRRVYLTPSTMHFIPPEVDLKNRITTEFEDRLDNFLRISLVDEGLNSLGEFSDSLTEYIRDVLTNLPILDRDFTLLAFSSSQLRESSAWMMY